MPALDSRALTYLDCFGQRFSRPGRVRYAVGSPLASCLETDDLPFSLTVGDARGDARTAQPRQHDVEVRFARGAFTAAVPELEIAVGDVVVWHATAATVPPHAVWGEEADRAPFSSAAMRDEAFYSHIFGSPGEYHWADPHGGPARGTVRVHDLDGRDRKTCGQWREVLKQGTLVELAGSTVKPAELDILVGQTVFFSVTGTEGISITDTAVSIPV
ncbi:cupredoxin domain-containing protein [Streptomyces daliensis]